MLFARLPRDFSHVTNAFSEVMEVLIHTTFICNFISSTFDQGPVPRYRNSFSSVTKPPLN